MGAWRVILLFITIVLFSACSSYLQMPLVTQEAIVSSPPKLNITPSNPIPALAFTPTESLLSPTFEPSSIARADLSKGKLLYQDFGVFVIPINCDLKEPSCKPTHQLITGWSGIYARPSWSPAGDEILFSSDMENETGMMSVYIIGDLGETITRLTPSGIYADFPKWSPDGQQIAFETGYGGHAMIINRDGTNLESISSLPSRHPEWSPNGDMLGFLVDRSANQSDLYIVSLSSMEELIIAENVGSDFAWSNIGSAIVYFLIDEQTLCIRQIEDSESTISTAETNCESLETRGAVGFEWSLTNDLLVFLSGEPFSPEIYSLHVEYGNNDDIYDLRIDRITNSGKDKRSAIWLGESELIAFFEDSSDGWSLVIVTIDGERYAILQTHLEAPSDLAWASLDD
jgi:dipeptidyl aminopeptidase/acylaminoacyl peptidase